MKSIEELVAQAAAETPPDYDPESDGEGWLLEYTTRFLAAYCEQQEPVAWLRDDGRYISPSSHEIHMARDNWAQGFDTKVYAAPVVPAGWLRAVDEAMVSSHLGVANATDTYDEARKKLNDLICWNNDVATDPAVNGGMVLVPRDALEALKYQRQCDEDGTEIAVSRQAVYELIADGRKRHERM